MLFQDRILVLIVPVPGHYLLFPYHEHQNDIACSWHSGTDSTSSPMGNDAHLRAIIQSEK